MKKLILFVLMLPMVALADPQPWMKKENPNELGVDTWSTDSCPITNSELQELVEGVLVRSRIKPVSFVGELGRGNPYLDVLLDCGADNTSLQRSPVDVRIDFIQSVFIEGKGNIRVRLGQIPAGSRFGVGNIEDIKQAIKDELEEVVADYLQANFDLGGDE